MSKALSEGRNFLRNMPRIGQDVDKELMNHEEICSQGDFKPRYEERTGKLYFSADNIDLNKENLKKLDAIAKARGLQLLYDEKFDAAILGYKRRFIPWPKEVIRIAGDNAQRIIVKDLDYVFYSQEGLLEEIGSVFGMKA
jgi:hypothetical protein